MQRPPGPSLAPVLLSDLPSLLLSLSIKSYAHQPRNTNSGHASRISSSFRRHHCPPLAAPALGVEGLPSAVFFFRKSWIHRVLLSLQICSSIPQTTNQKKIHNNNCGTTAAEKILVERCIFIFTFVHYCHASFSMALSMGVGMKRTPTTMKIRCFTLM